MKRTAFIAFSIVTTVYVFIGAVVFHFIEGKYEKKEKKHFEKDHRAFLEANTCISPEALRDYIILVIDAQAEGVPVTNIAINHVNISSNISGNGSSNNSSSGWDDHDDEKSPWDLVSAFLFCVTVVSTVGYGNIAPKTEGGQVFCIVFALIGIPLFATSMVGVGERLQIPLKKIKKCKPWYKSDPKKDEQLKTGVFLSSGICFIVFIPAILLSNAEDWTFIESLYFCIISLTTVGFGDYVPGQSKHLSYVYQIVLCVWILLGLSWIALILSELASIMQEKIIEATRRTSHKLGDFEDMVKKRARDAKDKIAQKVNPEMLLDWYIKSTTRTPDMDHSPHRKWCSADRDIDKDTSPSDGDEPEVSSDPSNIYVVVKSAMKNSPRRKESGQDNDNGIPGKYRSLSSGSQTVNDSDHNGDKQGDPIKPQEPLSRVDIE